MAKKKTRKKAAAKRTTRAPQARKKAEAVAPARAVGGPILPRAVGGPILPRTGAAADPETTGGRRVVGLGWVPDVPDGRDYDLTSSSVQGALANVNSGLASDRSTSSPKRIDNREYCSPIEDQGNLGSCTAQAVVGMMEYMTRRSGVPHIDGSRLFLYKVTRKLMGLTGDTGAYLRSTLKAVVAFGVPPEEYWPYVISRFEEEPSAFLYAYAASFQALNYARLDAVGNDGPKTLALLKRVLAAGYTAAFGFPVYDSLTNDADIPYPGPTDSLRGGHAVLAVGYDDNHRVGGRTVPSLIIRNSWGTSWGDDGYGYLPVAYVVDELALDFWTIFKEEWIDPTMFS